LPNGGDQEELGPLLAENEAVALTLLLSRAIRSIGDVCPPGPEHVSQLSPRARAEIEAEMERIAPRVETNIDTVCAECGRSFTVPFDVHRFFFGDFRTDSNLLYRQVHYLAYNYHWSESEIMDMPRTKRQKYIELLSDEMERLNDEQ
jgi:hypothetical protein